MMVFALFMIAGSVFPQPVVLKRITSDGQDALDLTIGLRKKALMGNYKVRHHSRKLYISAYERAGNKVGGEIWVMDRRSGEYKRGFVGMLFNSGGTAKQARLTATIYSGRCIKRQF
jgi:hypothetical protein